MGKCFELGVRFLWEIVAVGQLSLNPFPDLSSQFLIIEGQDEDLIALKGNNRIDGSHTESGKAWLSEFLGSATKNENGGIRITL